MKFNRMVRTVLAATTSMALGLGTVACSRDYTVAYVYAVSASNGTVSAYDVDYQSGVLTQITGSPFPTNFTNPTTLVATPSGKFLYVIGGSQNAAVEEIAVGTDGKLYGQNTYSITGTYPTAAAIDSSGSFLYVTFNYQGTGLTGSGGITIFPINADNSLGTPSTVAVGHNPVAIATDAQTCTVTPAVAGTTACAVGTSSSKNGFLNSFVYVIDQEPTTPPQILGFARTPAGGLTTVAGTVCTGTGAATACTGTNIGTTPSAMAIDPTGRYAYVTDKTTNQIYGFSIAYTATGALTAITGFPESTGLYPVSITIEPRGKYLYTANYNSNTVTGYSITSSNGSLGAAATNNFTTATAPTCVTVEPALGIYLYTSNYLDGSVSGGQLSPNTGAVNAIANTPFPSDSLPSCVVAVANGEHASSLVNP